MRASSISNSGLWAFWNKQRDFYRRALRCKSAPVNATFGGLVVRVRMAIDMKIIGYSLEAMKRKESLPFR